MSSTENDQNIVNEQPEEVIQNTNSFGCTSCGATLEFQPGTKHLTCQYCGAANEIPTIDIPIEELNFEQFLSNASNTEAQMTLSAINCKNCGAISSVEDKTVSAKCPYCATPFVIENVHDEKILQPKSLLPFKLNKEEAQTNFRKWIKKLWFAPNKLKKATLGFDHFKGVYMPYWTYDSNATTYYTGQRGEYYYVTETYSAMENGRSVTRTRQVRRTRWYPASGRVANVFDDVLVPANKSLPQKYLLNLEPWDLQNLTPFDSKFLTGFITQKYELDLKEGFDAGRVIMEKTIRRTVQQDIGGDTQRIFSMNSQYSNITFKHLLLPVYVSAYRFKDKLYRFFVNARSGEVQGERPWSKTKIFFAILLGIAIGVGIYFLVEKLGADPETVTP